MIKTNKINMINDCISPPELFVLTRCSETSRERIRWKQKNYLDIFPILSFSSLTSYILLKPLIFAIKA
jgi:hypothetical protein